ILEKIEEQNERQKEILSDPANVNEAGFDETVEFKGKLIDEILALDDGFQSLFDRVKQDIGDHKDLYAAQIKRMQKLIEEITGKSASIEASERRNKKLAEKYFSTAREHMNQSRNSSSVAFNYYQTMNNFRNIPPQFMDKKN
ncbi:MAG: flagellar protein FliT, partial [Butyrivibrio sp.]|nr:flagellar protein FliT [Butyrivibrio sp.]